SSRLGFLLTLVQVWCDQWHFLANVGNWDQSVVIYEIGYSRVGRRFKSSSCGPSAHAQHWPPRSNVAKHWVIQPILQKPARGDDVPCAQRRIGSLQICCRSSGAFSQPDRSAWSPSPNSSTSAASAQPAVGNDMFLRRKSLGRANNCAVDDRIALIIGNFHWCL